MKRIHHEPHTLLCHSFPFFKTALKNIPLAPPSLHSARAAGTEPLFYSCTALFLKFHPQSLLSASASARRCPPAPRPAPGRHFPAGTQARRGAAQGAGPAERRGGGFERWRLPEPAGPVLCSAADGARPERYRLGRPEGSPRGGEGVKGGRKEAVRGFGLAASSERAGRPRPQPPLPEPRGLSF